MVIVGDGVTGTMYAVEACRRGWEVIHLEADAASRQGRGMTLSPAIAEETWEVLTR